jgi:protein ImuB
MLWLCLHVPQLSLEVFSRSRPGDLSAPLAVVAGNGARQAVYACNTSAMAAGIHPGLKTASALALAGNLQVCERDEDAERRALEALAAWAMQFTSQVSLQPPDALLLEIGGSLRLFGGMEALLRRVRRCAFALGYHAACGVAPTPLGACILARSANPAPITRMSELGEALRGLPLDLLALDDDTLESLRGLGLRTLGELIDLPRSGFARRFGPGLLHRLDRMLGRRADPQSPFRPPERFERRLPLPAETADREALLFPAKRLLLELRGYLLGRQAGTRQLHWSFDHHRHPATRFTLGLATLSRDPRHIHLLLREHLTRISLEHPVVEIGLEVTGVAALTPRNLPLYDEPDATRADGLELVELLRARLGEDAVRGVLCRSDHRPERAWASARPGMTGALPPHAPRPLWLLDEPKTLELRSGRPWLHSPLRLESGPERIESGWWDGGDVARDYYIARDAAQARYWVFRERRGACGWFLHGLFA